MIKGSLVALITPFRNDEIDEDALANMVRWHIAQREAPGCSGNSVLS